MSSTRFHIDPDRIFPDHAYAPGYEPARTERDEPPTPMLPTGDMMGFIAAGGLVTGALALASVAMLLF